MKFSLRSYGTVTLASFALLGLSGSSVPAQAQSACVQQCRGSGWSYNQCARYCETTVAGQARATTGTPRTRVYGYRRQGGSCGEYRYLKGSVCVDARVDPPRLN
jgi:hypothetical protein